jgi:hypothetical protein
MNMENKEGKKLLALMFNDETVYASPDKYSSVWDDHMNDWRVHRPAVPVSQVPMDTTILVGVNPQKVGSMTRADENVSAYRSFLVELDEGTIEEQIAYLNASGLPKSAMIFSGSKSVHTLITLDKDLPNEEIYRFFAEWILKTLPKADQKTKNPSRGIRFPGVVRPETGDMQKLLWIGKRVPLVKLQAYLAKHRDKEPKIIKYDDFTPIQHNAKGMQTWVLKGIKEGFDMTNGRNQTWFAVGFEFGKCGYTVEQMITTCDAQFSPDKDFRRKEWEASLTNGYKRAIKEYWRKK